MRPASEILSTATVIAIALVVDGLSSRPWSMVLAGVGLVYGTIGVFTLGVTIDVALLAGAIVLMGLAIGGSTAKASERRPIRSLGTAVPQ